MSTKELSLERPKKHVIRTTIKCFAILVLFMSMWRALTLGAIFFHPSYGLTLNPESNITAVMTVVVNLLIAILSMVMIAACMIAKLGDSKLPLEEDGVKAGRLKGFV